jgi:hypothetical protein
MTPQTWKSMFEKKHPRDKDGNRLRRLVIFDDQVTDKAMMTYLGQRIKMCRHNGKDREFTYVWISSQKFTKDLNTDVREQMQYWFFFGQHLTRACLILGEKTPPKY